MSLKDVARGLPHRSVSAWATQLPILLVFVISLPAQALVVDLVADSDIPQVDFAAREIRGALESRGHRAMRFGSPDGIGIILGLRSELRSHVAGLPEMKAEDYSIRVALDPDLTTHHIDQPR